MQKQKLSDDVRKLLQKLNQQPCTKESLTPVERGRLFGLVYLGYVSGITQSGDTTVFTTTKLGRKALRG